MCKKLFFAFLLLALGPIGFSQSLKINDQGYFEERGNNILVYSYPYSGIFYDEKTSGVEIIQAGVRTATGGAVRLQHTPEQWDQIPKMTNRIVDTANNRIEVELYYELFDFYSKIIVTSKGKGVEMSVVLDKPVPAELVGRAGLNLEFLPSAYFEKSFLADGKPGNFPLYPSDSMTVRPLSEKIPQFSGFSTFDDRGRGEFLDPSAFARANTFIFAPEDQERKIKIEAETPGQELMLFDGRNLAQNGWYIVRSLLPAGKTGKVLSWYIEPHAIPDWIRTPVIQFSQVGYNPQQQKIAVIELDKNDTPLKHAKLYRVNEGGEKLVTEKETQDWGRFYRYHYLSFDFSAVREPGIYFIEYGSERTNTFAIGNEVYAGIWHPTLDVWFPVQMDHMQVNEAYRVWHGAPFLDDAVQAPVDWQHFDNYKMGPSTQTKFKPYERIPGLATGGWFDAGDFDIQTGSHCNAVLSLVDTWENFQPTRDQTFVDYPTKYVDIHRPDGQPDMLQQIRHGILPVLAQVKNIGHPGRGIVVPRLHQYTHLGDAVNETDNLPYNPELKPYEVKDGMSGTPDDRWVFTERIASLDYYTVAALAAAHRTMRGFDDTLAAQTLHYAIQLWNDEDSIRGADPNWQVPAGMKLMAGLQLFISTNDKKYLNDFEKETWKGLDESLYMMLPLALNAIPHFGADYKNKLTPYIQKYKLYADNLLKENPYGVPIEAGGWGGSGSVVRFSTTNFYVHKYFPEMMDEEYVFRGLNYIFGCHPYSNLSFVSSVGTKSKKVTYGNNRADYSFIAGGIVPGVLLIKSDFLENKEDWPFFWGENEVTVGGCANYIFLANAAQHLIGQQKE